MEEALVQNKQSLETTRLTYWAGRYCDLIAQGLATNPPPEGGWPRNKRGRPKQTKAKNLVDRLDTH